MIFQCNVKYCLGPCEPVSESFQKSPSIQSKLDKTNNNVFSFAGRLRVRSRLLGILGQEAQKKPGQLDRGGEGRGHDPVAGDPRPRLWRREAVPVLEERRQYRLQRGRLVPALITPQSKLFLVCAYSKRKKMNFRQNGDDNGALPHEDIGSRAGSDVRAADPDLRVDDLLLLHEEVAHAQEDDALNPSSTKPTPAQARSEESPKYSRPINFLTRYGVVVVVAAVVTPHASTGIQSTGGMSEIIQEIFFILGQALNFREGCASSGDESVCV